MPPRSPAQAVNGHEVIIIDSDENGDEDVDSEELDFGLSYCNMSAYDFETADHEAEYQDKIFAILLEFYSRIRDTVDARMLRNMFKVVLENLVNGAAPYNDRTEERRDKLRGMVTEWYGFLCHHADDHMYDLSRKFVRADLSEEARLVDDLMWDPEARVRRWAEMWCGVIVSIRAFERPTEEKEEEEEDDDEDEKDED